MPDAVAVHPEVAVWGRTRVFVSVVDHDRQLKAFHGMKLTAEGNQFYFLIVFDITPAT